MKLPRRKFLDLAAVAAALPAVSRIARAQSYPTRPITFNVPFPAGGPTDAIARVMGERMRVALGQPILIENVSGAAARSVLAASHTRRRTAIQSVSAIGAHMSSTARSTI